MFVIKGIVMNTECYFVDTYLDKKVDYIVRRMSETIEGATLFDSMEKAEEVLEELNSPYNPTLKIYPVCPICHKEYTDRPALSRADNKTNICPRCGLAESTLLVMKELKKGNSIHIKNVGGDN